MTGPTATHWTWSEKLNHAASDKVPPEMALTWQYAAITDSGPEFLYGNEFQAFDKLNAMDVPGRVEYRDLLSGEVTVIYVRGADGRWTSPPQPPEPDDDEVLAEAARLGLRYNEHHDERGQ